MRNTIQKSVDVISGLVQKHIVINNKIKQNTLNQQNYSELNNKLDSLEQLIGSNTSSTSTSMDFYKCSSVETTENRWTGYKAVLTDGVYSFEDAVTEGLTYGIAYKPEIEKVYNADCTISIENMYMYKNLFFGATGNNSGTGIRATFATAGRSDTAYYPYRANITDSVPFVITGQTKNKETWSSVVIFDAAQGIEVSRVIAYVHNYTELDNKYTVTAARLEGSNDGDTWDVLSRLEGVNSTGAWTFSCSTKNVYRSLRVVFVMAIDGPGAVLWKVDIDGFCKYIGIPDATPYNPTSVESEDYTITYSYTWWSDDRPWMAFNFGENADQWGSDTSDSGVGQWLAWENKKKAVCIKRYQYRASSDNIDQGCALQGFDEDTGEWITIDEQLRSYVDGVKIYNCSTNTRAFRKHRFLCTQMGEGHHFQLAHIAAWTY